MFCQEESVEERRLDMPSTSTGQSLSRASVPDKLCNRYRRNKRES